MQGIKFIIKSLLVFLFFFSSFCYSVYAADPIIEYYFWDQMGKQAGNAARSYNDYHSKRTEIKSNIIRLEMELEKCGNCPKRAEIEEEYNYWKGTEEALNTIVRHVLYAFNDRETAEFYGKLFDIDMYEYKMPPIVKSLPELCQKLHEDYSDCLHENNVSGLSDVCQDHYNIFKICEKGDKAELSRAMEIVELRKTGVIIPEIRYYSHTLEVYYGDVPDNFVPDMPPADVLALERIYKINMRKKSPGKLFSVNVGSFRQVPGVSVYDFHGSVRNIY